MPATAAITAFNDQYRAAARDARRTLSRLAEPAPIRPGDTPWLVHQAAALLAHLRAGTARCCPHVTTTPRVLHAAVWAPGALVCERCVRRIRPTTQAEDATCDRCHQVVPLIHAGAAAIGPILLAYGLCPHCIHAIGPHDRKDTNQ